VGLDWESNDGSAPVYEELATCLMPMLDRLPQTYREAVVLAELDGLTQREAAEQLGLSLSGAKSRVQRGRKALRLMLDECCHVQLDAGGRPMDYSVRDGSCNGCGCTS
jgi:RNA polymerase sigma-70 factor (ECF subfamily)